MYVSSVALNGMSCGIACLGALQARPCNRCRDNLSDACDAGVGLRISFASVSVCAAFQTDSCTRASSRKQACTQPSRPHTPTQASGDKRRRWRYCLLTVRAQMLHSPDSEFLRTERRIKRARGLPCTVSPLHTVIRVCVPKNTSLLQATLYTRLHFDPLICFPASFAFTGAVSRDH